jgi:perosamine synthetase
MDPYLYWLPAGLPFLKIGETRFYNDFPMSRLNRAKSGAMFFWKRKLESLNETRRNMSEHYKNELNLNRKVGIYSRDVPYLRFPVYLRNEQVKIKMCDEYKNIGVSPMYPGSIGSIPEIEEVVAGHPSPQSAKIARTLVTLPTHNLVDETTRKKICDVISNAMDHEFKNG